MPDRYTSDRSTVGSLLTLTSPPIQVPEWQRSYSWQSAHVETFWKDLTIFSDRYPAETIDEEEYFLGAIVIVETGPSHLLLDGQQRLATATILLSVMRDYLNRYRRDAAGRVQQRYIADIDDATNTTTYKLTMNRYDRDFFRREVQEFPADARADPELGSHHLIRNARLFFERQFETNYERFNGGRAAYDWALRIQKVVTNHVSVVAVSSTDQDNASSVFETLNDRGIGLSTPDLLRTLVLRRAHNDGEREEIIEHWRTVLETEEEAGVQNFLRHYWLSHYGDIKTHSLYREIKQHLEAHNTDSLQFSRELSAGASLYWDIVTASDNDPDLKRSLQAVEMLGAAALLPAILSAYSIEDIDGRKRLLHALVSTFVRHSVIGNLENSKLENVVFDLARQLRRDRDFGTAVRRLAEFAPGDPQFRVGFRTAQLTRRNSARYILRELEHALRITQELAVEGPERVHVEHIYPQTPENGQRWENHAALVDRLGNLTLLARRLNERIRNATFDQKKPEYARSDLLLTQRLLGYDAWSPHAISERQEWMADLAEDVWKVA